MRQASMSCAAPLLSDAHIRQAKLIAADRTGAPVVIFTAYFDEADTHGSAPTVILAAFVGHTHQWHRFGKRLSKIQKRESFSIFHATEFKTRTGEFWGWSDVQRARLINELTSLVQNNLTEGLTIALTRERYETEYRSEPFPPKMHRDSQYGVCFRACMGRLFDLMAEYNCEPRLNVVMERGHPNVRDCERIFNDLRHHCETLACSNFLGKFSIETKVNCPPLMVADMLAATYSMYRKESMQGAIGPLDFAAGPQTKGRLAFLELRPDALRDLKVGFEKMIQVKKEHWRSKRAKQS
jgi:hypothetical protein